MNKINDSQSGQTLVEMLIAVVILSMVSIAFVKFTTVSLHMATFYNAQHEAYVLADNEALAILNNAYSDIQNTISPSNSPYSITKNNILYTIHVTQDTTFNDPDDPLLKEYTVKVSWPSDLDNGTYDVQLNVYAS